MCLPVFIEVDGLPKSLLRTALLWYTCRYLSSLCLKEPGTLKNGIVHIILHV